MIVEAVRSGDVAALKRALESGAEDVNQVDASGATALHYAAEIGNREMVAELLRHGADVNARDARFGATPAGWAIEYLRPSGAHLGIELDDLAYAIQTRDARWVKRFLQRFPKLRDAVFKDGVRFRDLAGELGDPEIAALFG